MAACKPLTVMGLEPFMDVPVQEPGADVAIQLVIEVPPFELRVKGTVAVKADSAMAEPIEGAVGTVQVVMRFETADAAD